MTDSDLQKMRTTGELLLNDNSQNEKIKEQVNSLIDTYHFLKLYPDYIKFLKAFSGLAYFENDVDNTLSFYGFDNEVALDIVKGEGDIIDEKGFFVFGAFTCCIEETGQYKYSGFGVDATNTREKGIYSFNETDEKMAASSFGELIAVFVNDRDKLLFA